MVSGLRYRVASVAGTFLVTLVAVLVANAPPVQWFVTGTFPVLSRLEPTVLGGRELAVATVTTIGTAIVLLTPLYKPRPRRILNTVAITARRIGIVGLVLSTVGYFDYTYRLPRTTLIIVIVGLLLSLPAWFVAIRRRPDGEPERVLIVGDQPSEIDRIIESLDTTIVGYVAPSERYAAGAGTADPPPVTDGAGEIVEIGAPHSTAKNSALDLPCLGGFARLEDALLEHDIDTVVFALHETDRQEFFGALAACHDHGVEAMIHRDHADSVLVDDTRGEEIVDIVVEPWDWQERVAKRTFDLAFAATGVVLAAPLMAVIAMAIKLDSSGPILYSQERTAEFGDRFTVYKFRSMVENAESETGATLSEEDRGGVDPRVTRVGRLLRRTHLDEIPQLWSILVGDMSVVGPRPERPVIDQDIESDVDDWRRRWFVKPGLTGLAQINGITGDDPKAKVRYDLEYIQRQSLRTDVTIVIRQFWVVFRDLIGFLVGRGE